MFFFLFDLCILGLLGICSGCRREFVKYYPSAFETEWVDNIATWQDNVCDHIRSSSQEPKFRAFHALMDAAELEFVEGVGCGPARQKIESQYHDLFSQMEYRYFCPITSNPLHLAVRNESIEPLVGFLRQPRGICPRPRLFQGQKGDLKDKSFIVFSNMNCEGLTGQKSTPKLIIQDLGSTTYAMSLSGPSQQYLVDKYTNHGYTNLHRLMAWEAVLYPRIQGYFDQVPKEVMPYYQFFNVPISAEVGSPYNPLTLLQEIASPHDFVSVKLDVDNSDIEFSIIDQILNTLAITSLVDKFFFEHHSTVYEMTWAWRKVSRGELQLGYKFFKEMREKGIRAHSWI